MVSSVPASTVRVAQTALNRAPAAGPVVIPKEHLVTKKYGNSIKVTYHKELVLERMESRADWSTEVSHSELARSPFCADPAPGVLTHRSGSP